MRPYDDIRDPTKPRYHRRTVPGVIKAFEGEEGIVEGYASVAGVLDSYKEIVDKGAFKRTLKENEGRIAFCWQHDWHEVIGLIKEIREVPRSKLPKAIQERYPEATAGLWFRSQVLDTRQGQDAKVLLRAKAVKEMSIGFDLYEDGHYKDDNGIVHLRHIMLYEISPVTMGAMPAAQIVGYKGEIPPPPKLDKLDGVTNLLGKTIYARTGDGRWWSRKWQGSKETEPSQDWELMTELESCLTKPGETLELAIKEIVPGVNIYSLRIVDIPYGKPEETEDFISIPNPGIGDCDVTATITISEDEGIQARYCGKIKKVRTFIFAKAKGWTMAKAQKWVDDHKDEFKTGVIIGVATVMQKVLDNQLEEAYTLLRELVSELPQPTLGEAEELALRIDLLEAETRTL